MRAPVHASLGIAPATAGDESARLNRILREQHAFIWRCTRRFGVAEAAVDDVVQEVFIVASRRLATIESGRERAFLTQTALYLASNWRRARRRCPELPSEPSVEDVPEPGPNVEERLDQRRERQMLDRALDTLSQEQRAVLVLCDIDELTRAEVAELLDLAPGTVASRLKAAREQLARTVNQLWSEPQREVV
jgi:RNA polymerase sigma-70 factor, ECF subfamily